MSAMTVEEFDPQKVLEHLELEVEQMPMFACLAGDLRTTVKVGQKIKDHFGSKNYFFNIAKFIKKVRAWRILKFL